MTKQRYMYRYASFVWQTFAIYVMNIGCESKC